MRPLGSVGGEPPFDFEDIGDEAPHPTNTPKLPTPSIGKIALFNMELGLWRNVVARKNQL